MSYTITLTNGNTLAVVADQSFDQVSSSITLIGKNVNAYGQYVNENFVQLLENFANIAAPTNPITGQLWFDTSAQQLKVYSGALSDFKPVGSPIIFATNDPAAEPTNSVQGDLWWNPTFKELKYLDNSGWLKISEQSNPLGKGKSGWFVEHQTDGSNDNAVSALYNEGTLLAVATDVQLTLNQGNAYVPFLGTTTLQPGITLNPSYAIYGTATNSLNWNNLSTSTFMQRDIYQSTKGAIDIFNNAGLGVGTPVNVGDPRYPGYANMQLLVDNYASTTTSVIQIANINENFAVRYNNGVIGTSTAIALDGKNNYLGIFQSVPTTSLDVNGDTLIRGNLTVLGTVTNIEATTLEVTATNVILANGNNLDAVANGGGIILEGTTPKTLLWYSTTTAWTSSENLDLASTSTYKIGGVTVLSNNSLGTGIQHAPGIVDLPPLNTFTASNLYIANYGPSNSGGIYKGPYYDTLTQQTFWSDLYIESTGTGNINLGGYTQIIGSAQTTASSVSSSLITKGYFDSFLGDISQATAVRKTFTVTMDITPVSNSPDSDINNFIIGYLSKMLPIDGTIGGTDPYGDSSYYKLPLNTRCTVLAQYYTGTFLTFNLTLNKSTVLVDKGGVQNSQSVLQDVASTATITDPNNSSFIPQVNHLIKSFYVLDDGTGNNNTWTFVANIL
jgi:hypothetical protein